VCAAPGGRDVMSYASLRARRAKQLAVLFGTASVASLASSLAYAQAVNEVLITGSLIAGTPAVGIPVTNLGPQDFAETGAISVLDLLETVPALTIPPTNSPAFGAGTLHFSANVQIHGLGDGDTLMMQDGRRWPLQGYDGFRVDPAIFPQLAISRVDVLAAGASATYGADATAGVINIILKRGFDGAESYVRFGGAPGAGAESVTASQFYGRTWDSGSVNLTYEHISQRHVEAKDLFYLTWNFDDAGFEGFDFTLADSSNPGFVSTGRAGPSSANRVFVERNGGVLCNNCYALPNGIGWDYGSQAPGPTATWADILANPGVNKDNIINPWIDGWARPSLESNAAVMTFDQRLADNLDLFGFDLGPVDLIVDGVYSNRRYKQNYPSDQGQGRENITPGRDGYRVPTNNPYRPTGAPGDLRVHWTLDPEIDTPIVSGGQVNARWRAGFEFDELPFDWHGLFDYTVTDNKSFGYDRGGIILNMALAALGNTVTYNSGLGTQTIVKPANIPYLNPFCDSTVFRCNSPATIEYMQGYRDQFLYSHFSEINLQVDGPIFKLPAGSVAVALAYNHLNKSQHFYQEDTTNSNFRDDEVITEDYINELSNAYVFQANIPVFGTGFNFPMFESLDVELGYRFDQYKGLEGTVKTPKIGVNWGIGWGLTARASYGKAFRTPKGEEISSSGAGIAGVNAASGVVSVDAYPLNCTGTPTPGSLTAILNPTCSTDPDLVGPVGIEVSGPPLLTGPILAGSGLVPPGTSVSLGPQKAKQWNAGFSFIPGPDHFGGLLNGLNVDVTWWKINYDDLIGGTFSGSGPNDPNSTPYFIPISNPTAAITDPSNAAFWALVQQLAATPTRTARAPAPTELLETKFIALDLTGNIGEAENEGVDFTVRYDFEAGNWGSFHVGASGYYELENRVRSNPDSPWTDSYYLVAFEDLQTRGNQLKRVRYRAGWTDGTWNVTTFFNYTGHSADDVFGNIMLPDCFHAQGGGPGGCYPGSPYYGPYDADKFPLHSPANVTVDLSLGYSTGDMPANEYLRNINIQLGVTNLLDKNPPLGVHPLRSRGTGVAAYDRNYSDLRREVSLTINKSW